MLAVVRKFFGNETDLLVTNLRRAESTIEVMTKRIEQLSIQRVEPVHVLPEETVLLYKRIDFLRGVITDVITITENEAKHRLEGALILDNEVAH